jgi:hypothetical protein
VEEDLVVGVVVPVLVVVVVVVVVPVVAAAQWQWLVSRIATAASKTIIRNEEKGAWRGGAMIEMEENSTQKKRMKIDVSSGSLVVDAAVVVVDDNYYYRCNRSLCRTVNSIKIIGMVLLLLLLSLSLSSPSLRVSCTIMF